MNSLSEQEISSPENRRRIAPLWHTAMVILILLSVSALSAHSSQHGFLGHNHLPSYALTFVMEWLLAFFVLWGIRRNGVSLRQLLGKTRPGLDQWLEDFGLALAFWLLSLVVLGILAVGLKLAHAGSPQKAALALAPATIPEVAAWVVLSITAGICEELIFRGYLQQQFAALGNSAPTGILASAVLFGFAHGYEGISGVVLITVYGAMFSVLALKRGALRTCMMAHAFHDAIAGIALAVLRSTHQLS
jgi:CAAX protease family protein